MGRDLDVFSYNSKYELKWPSKKNKKTNCSQQPFVRKKKSEEQQLFLKMHVDFQGSERIIIFQSGAATTLQPIHCWIRCQRHDLQHFRGWIENRVGSIFVVCFCFFCFGISSLQLEFGHETMILTKWMGLSWWMIGRHVYHSKDEEVDCWCLQPFLTSGLYRWSSQRDLWCSSADWESGELFRWKLGQNSLEQFHSSWRYFIHPPWTHRQQQVDGLPFISWHTGSYTYIPRYSHVYIYIWLHIYLVLSHLPLPVSYHQFRLPSLKLTATKIAPEKWMIWVGWFFFPFGLVDFSGAGC